MKKHISFLKLVLFFVFAFLLNGVVMAQTKKVTGLVKDEAGEALIGVSVQVKGTTVGTMTDFNGAYSLDIPEGSSTLVFTYIGMKTEEKPITGEVISIAMVGESTSLEEVVVVGYGTMKKKDLTGATTSISKADIASNKAANALSVLQGKVTGLDIIPSSGQAGAGVEMLLRGKRSITGINDPLILVDGVEYGIYPNYN